jgi:tetratricopeptide (TPR) repeat protein
VNADVTIDRCPGAAMPAQAPKPEVDDGIRASRQSDRELLEILAAERDHEARLRMRRQRLLARAGDGLAAAREGELARRASTPELTPDVELELAARDASLGKLAEAERRYEAVLDVLEASSPLGALTAFRLAHLLLERREHHAAADLLERALHGANTNLLPHVELALAGELDSVRHRVRVRQLYEAVLRSDHPDLAPRAAVLLGVLHEADGDLTTAVRFYELAIRSEHPEHGPDARVHRSALMHGRATEAIGDAVRAAAPPRDAGTPVWTFESQPAGPPPAIGAGCNVCFAYPRDTPHAEGFGRLMWIVPMYGRSGLDVEPAGNSFILGAVTDALARARCELALATGALWSRGAWSSALDRRQPGVAAWAEAFEGCKCGRNRASQGTL